MAERDEQVNQSGATGDTSGASYLSSLKRKVKVSPIAGDVSAPQQPKASKVEQKDTSGIGAISTLKAGAAKVSNAVGAPSIIGDSIEGKGDVFKGGVTELLSNQMLGRVERMRIQSNRKFTNRMRGEHLSGKGGQSTEFSDYRDYVAGDDIRYVDWNIFSRLGRPYLKQFHHEEEQQLVLIIDRSNSMLFGGKLQRAKAIAAAMGVMGLFGNEKVSAYVVGVDEDTQQCLRPCSGRGSMHKLFKYLEGIEGGGNELIENGIERVLRTHRGKGVAVLLSDFLTYGDVGAGLTRLRGRELEIFAMQILSEVEVNPDLDGDLKFVDSEGAGTLDVSAAGDVVGIYQEYRLRYERQLEDHCRKRGGRFLSISAADHLQYVLFDLLVRKGWAR
ncbi:DUF58 domain-containing protein [Poriferisphaera sp. WC338]|uniref:DUF58 domain-containing protein n=1 Tax=Poriferisphaera sp. WC338 TaxID=3425129 RepID=UPI003D81A244